MSPEGSVFRLNHRFSSIFFVDRDRQQPRPGFNRCSHVCLCQKIRYLSHRQKGVLCFYSTPAALRSSLARNIKKKTQTLTQANLGGADEVCKQGLLSTSSRPLYGKTNKRGTDDTMTHDSLQVNVRTLKPFKKKCFQSATAQTDN